MGTLDTAPAAKPHGLVHLLGRCGRFLIFLCTAGWLYPHVCTERMDLTAIQERHAAKQ
jgi:hypothetical protein